MNLSHQHLLDRAANWPLERLLDSAASLRDEGWGNVVTYSPKVFIPLTELCRDVCHYCTYAKTPRHVHEPFLPAEKVLELAHAGRRAGCREALFTLGDKPEQRYRSAREALARLGHATTLDYLHEMAARVLRETGLLPHLNAGTMSFDEFSRLRAVAPSMGIMLESASDRLCLRGGPHFGSPDKLPAVRLATLRAAGLASVPFSSGILIGIGETREERIASLLALRELHAEHGHIQEIIIQNFVPKPGTKMAKSAPPSRADLLWTIAMARHVFGPAMSLQAPPNLNAVETAQLIGAGINDWGGVSPITPDHVNPESPWPTLEHLDAVTSGAGKTLVPRLTIYRSFIQDRDRWIDPGLARYVLAHSDTDGLARDDHRDPPWAAGADVAPIDRPRPDTLPRPLRDRRIATLIAAARSGSRLSEAEVATLYRARGSDYENVCESANELRREVCGDEVTYIVTRNINYTNICLYHCSFCAFSKGRGSEDLRGAPYVVDLEEIARRTAEAWQRGATEVCLQGGIHPHFTGQTYLDVCRAAREGAPGIHIHAFSPLEVAHGAETLGLSVPAFLARLKAAGLGTLPGTAAEILDDEVRRIICPDKLDTARWLEIIAAAHQIGLRTTSTIMFGHVERIEHWARHLLALRDLQERTGGITEFVPLPYVHMEAPMHRRGQSRPGPTYREAVLMHAVPRLVLHPLIRNIQVSWVKLGPQGVADCLNAGANDLGGTLMNESISRAAGANHGQEMPPEAMQAAIRAIGRTPLQRNTLYKEVPAERAAQSYGAAPLAPVRSAGAREYHLAVRRRALN
ncbi:MAG TPA: 5-amino-6-(D-ribitylamino)uracil--L-tyrosine 4-hydroxyphenyl transferase CofH [Steroidobacteraceae bacterium]|nr:5-amino-6-(D-ribitylamino)uracil--L-tyrosine 4-hydroxyphenyl transferase CofH [Steroidobacteraceae bacterium]